MRNKINHPSILLLVLISNPVISGGVEVPDKWIDAYVQGYEGIFCRDSEFTACIDISQDACTVNIEDVMNDCGYESMWDVSVNNRKNGTSDEEIAEYRECLTNRFSEQFSLEPKVFEKCYAKRMERYWPVK